MTAIHLYVENVDPLVKLFHARSFHQQFLNVVGNWDALDLDTETLLFAIYFAVIVSLSNEDCLDRLKGSKVELLER